MKDQYVGDVKGYFKYRLLRALDANDLPLVACWMLTEPDGRRVAAVEASSLLRAGYARTTAEAHALEGPPSLVFLDPDQGFEVRSVPRGTARSAEYWVWAA